MLCRQHFCCLPVGHLGLETCLFRDPLTERLLSALAGANINAREITLGNHKIKK